MTSQSKRMGNRIREARLAMGLNQEGLAHAANVSVSTVSRLEQGRTTYPRPDEFERIAAALGTTTDALKGIDDEPESIEEGEPSDEALDADIEALSQDMDRWIAFMGKVRDPRKMSRTAKLVILEELRKSDPPQQRRG